MIPAYLLNIGFDDKNNRSPKLLGASWSCSTYPHLWSSQRNELLLSMRIISTISHVKVQNLKSLMNKTFFSLSFDSHCRRDFYLCWYCEWSHHLVRQWSRLQHSPADEISGQKPRKLVLTSSLLPDWGFALGF